MSRRNAKIRDADTLLRFILLHVGANLPLRQTVALTAEAQLPNTSPMRLHKKMCRAAPYLQALVSGMLDWSATGSTEKWGAYVFTAVDATVVCGPGAIGTDARIHIKLRVADVSLASVEVTDETGGETFCRFEHEVKPRLRGPAFLVRYADDFVIVSSVEQDARKVLEVLPKRFDKYRLRLHPEKTRLVRFRRPPLMRELPKEKEPESFGFLGFQLYWARSKKGNWIILCKTASSRLARALVRVNDWCRAHRHDPIREQHRTLTSKLRGHYNYFAITGNHRAVHALRFLVTRVWFKWLRRRSRANPDWAWMNRMR